AMNTLDYYQTQLGSLDAYLGKFQDVAYYRGSPCFKATGGCTEAEWAAMNANRRLASESQKRANDDLFHTLKQQQDALQSDARTLERLQHSAQGAAGHRQALGDRNRLGTQHANQPWALRAMLLAQYHVLATPMPADDDLHAKQQAAHAASTESRIAPTSTP